MRPQAIGRLVSTLQLITRFPTDPSGTLRIRMFSKVFDVSEAIWALKSIFYAIDHRSAGFVHVEDILTALSDARSPQGTSTSDLTHPRQTADYAKVAKGAATGTPDSEAHGDEQAEKTLLGRLSRLGVGVRSSDGGCDGADSPGDGAGLVPYVRHLLAPPVSKQPGRGQPNRQACCNCRRRPAQQMAPPSN